MKEELISSLEPLLVCFMMFSNPYEFHVHSKPWSKLNQSKMVPQSQLIQLFIQRSCLKKKIYSYGHKKDLIIFNHK